MPGAQRDGGVHAGVDMPEDLEQAWSSRPHQRFAVASSMPVSMRLSDPRLTVPQGGLCGASARLSLELDHVSTDVIDPGTGGAILLNEDVQLRGVPAVLYIARRQTIRRRYETLREPQRDRVSRYLQPSSGGDLLGCKDEFAPNCPHLVPPRDLLESECPDGATRSTISSRAPPQIPNCDRTRRQ